MTIKIGHLLNVASFTPCNLRLTVLLKFILKQLIIISSNSRVFEAHLSYKIYTYKLTVLYTRYKRYNIKLKRQQNL